MGDPVCSTEKPFDALQKVIVFAFEVAEKEILDAPDKLEKALASEDVRQAMVTALSTLALTGKTNTGQPDESRKVAEALLGSAGKAAGKAFTEDLKKTPGVQQLQQCFTDFQTALKKSPAGVWVDKSVANKITVYVVGLGLVVGGATALFRSKVDNPALNFALDQLSGASFEVFKVGKLSVDGQLLKFDPAKQNIGAGLVFTEKWEKVTAKLQVGVVASALDAPANANKALIKSEPFKLVQDGDMRPGEKRISFGVGVTMPAGPLPGKFNLSIGAIVSDQTGVGGQITADLKTKGAGTFSLKGTADSHQQGGYLLWSIDL
jgi:hypothetical protein